MKKEDLKWQKERQRRKKAGEESPLMKRNFQSPNKAEDKAYQLNLDRVKSVSWEDLLALE